MIAYLLRRIAVLIPSFFGLTLLTFTLIRLIPGDPVEAMMGERRLDPAMHAAALKRLGLDKPLYVQYFNYICDLLTGNLGVSVVSQRNVWDEFKSLFPATLELALCAIVFASVLGLIVGMIAAIRRGSIFDHGVMGLSLTGYSMPIFWWGLLLIMLFSAQLRWTPVSGRLSMLFDVPPETGFMLIDAWVAESADPRLNQGAFLDAIKHLILPSIVLATIPLAVIARMTRSSVLEVLREDYVRTARAKGLSPTRIVLVHILRNALIPVLTVIGLQVGTLMGGAVLTETIFSWPGVGKWLIDAISRRDYPVVQNGILLIATLVVLTNFVVDVLYGVVNPRIRHSK